MPRIEWSKYEFGECTSLAEVPKGATVDAIDGVSPVGQCDRCGRYIAHGEKYAVRKDGIELVCYKCTG